MVTINKEQSIPKRSRDPRLVLASSSRYKRGLLRRLGLPFAAEDPGIDEGRLANEAPADLARRLAYEKAAALRATCPGAFLLGADQVIALGDRTFGKPGRPERAREQLQALQGCTHLLLNGVALLTPDGKLFQELITYEMDMRPLSPAQVADYVHEDRPLDCAGAYKIEAAGIRLFLATRGPDPTAIEGLPLMTVWTLLHRAGYFDE